jgi:hypothetical protein
MLALPGTTLGAADTPQAGVAGAVVGDVEVAGKPRPAPKPVDSGMEIFLKDRIATAVESRLQVLLLDETVFTVGPDSKVTIDKFVYDPSTGAGEVTAKFAEGFMRYVSGKVGENNPEDVSIETPASTIGVRGTSLFVSQAPDAPDTYVAGLLGPGPDNNARAQRGGFTMTNDKGSVSVVRPGFGVRVTEGEAPQQPSRLSQNLLERLHVGLRPRQRRGDVNQKGEGQTATAQRVSPADSDSSVAETSGQTVAGTRTTSLQQKVLENRQQQNVHDTNRASVTANQRPDAVRSLFAQAPDRPPRGIEAPLLAQARWQNIPDLGLHVTGPNPDSFGRFHVFFASPEGPTGANGRPVARLSNDSAAVGGTEVATINELVDGGPTRISVFNFANQTPGGTELASDADLRVSLLKNGEIRRGPDGSVLVTGAKLLDRVSPRRGGRGNTFVAFEIAPNGDVTRVRETRDFPNAGVVR